jgi:hypothetical protein
MKTNATIQELEQALTAVNKRFDNNIKFKRLEQQGKRITFTLTVINSSGSGHRTGTQKTVKGGYKKLAAACWHVHGYFFEELFKINPSAFIKTGQNKIDINGGNWQDRNIDSVFNPLRFSQACECHVAQSLHKL